MPKYSAVMHKSVIKMVTPGNVNPKVTSAIVSHIATETSACNQNLFLVGFVKKRTIIILRQHTGCHNGFGAFSCVHTGVPSAI